MRFTAATLVSLLATTSFATPVLRSSLQPVSRATPGSDLATWLVDSVNAFFPNHEGWDASFDAIFDDSAKGSFNQLSFDKAGLKQFYTGMYPVLTGKYSSFTVEFTSVVAVPNKNDIGGSVVATGEETGVAKDTGDKRVETNGCFAVVKEVNGERKIIEFCQVTYEVFTRSWDEAL